LPRHFLRCGPFDHLQAEGMADPPDVLNHGGEKLKKTVPIPVIFKDPAPEVARQDPFAFTSRRSLAHLKIGQFSKSGLNDT
jgi:hypothetical protein